MSLTIYNILQVAYYYMIRKRATYMMRYTEVLETIFASIKEVNKQLPESGRLMCDESTIILGDESTLDSLVLVILFVDIEERINEAYKPCGILDAVTEARDDVYPFTTISEMATWIQKNS